MRASAELVTSLGDASRSHPDKIAFKEDDLSVSYERFGRDVDTLALRLVEEGIRPGDIVAVHIGRPGAHWALLVALMRVGAVSVSLTERYRAGDRRMPESCPSCCARQGNGRSIPARIASLKSIAIGLKRPRLHPIWPTRASPTAVSGESVSPPVRPASPRQSSWTRRPSGIACLERPPAAELPGGQSSGAAWGAIRPTGSPPPWPPGSLGGRFLFATRREDIVRGDVNLIIASPAALNALRKSDAPGGASGNARRNRRDGHCCWRPPVYDIA